MGEKTSYSVPQIKSMLGIGKTSAYALVKSGCFDTVVAGNQIRVMKNSFEQWLRSQSHYHFTEGGTQDGINY